MPEEFNQSLIDGGRPYWVWGPLVFTSFYFLPLIFSSQHFSVITGLLSIVIYISFLFLYHKAANSRGTKVLPIIVLMLSLCVLGTSITPGTQALFGFISFFCGFNFSAKKGLFGLVSIVLAIFFSAFAFNFIDVYFIAPAVIVSAALFFMGQAERKDRIHALKEKASQDSIEQLATIAERERIARDLHDLIGHSLTSIALKAELADKYLQVEKNTLAKQEINEVALLSRDILSQVRQAVSGLKTKDITAHIQQLTAKLIHHNFTVNVSNNLVNTSAIIESSLILMLTEAVTNVLKHSNGNKVSIALEQAKGAILLTISDNGKLANLVTGNGLTGIVERCEQLNGSVEFDNSQGMSITIKLPEVNHD